MYKKIFLSTMSLLLISIVLFGCSPSSTGIYQGILSLNEKRYILQGELKNDELTIGEKIGEVQKNVQPQVMPTEHLSSNYLEVGEEIYSSNEDQTTLIVKRESGQLEIMKEEGF